MVFEDLVIEAQVKECGIGGTSGLITNMLP